MSVWLMVDIYPHDPRDNTPDSMVHEAYMGPTWGRQDPGGPHVSPMNLTIMESTSFRLLTLALTLIWRIIDKPG